MALLPSPPEPMTPQTSLSTIPQDVVRFVCISDTHSAKPHIAVPDGDVLIHAGDFTMQGTLHEAKLFNRWLGKLPHRHKIVICGNHDLVFDQELMLAYGGNGENPWQVLSNATYLQDQHTYLYGLKVYGAPWTPTIGYPAFNLNCGRPCQEKWSTIPRDIDILVTHGPPQGQGDLTRSGRNVGCAQLMAVVEEVKPRCHVFGHIHEGYGVTRTQDTVFINASTCAKHYQPINPPVTFDMPLPPGHTKPAPEPQATTTLPDSIEMEDLFQY